MNDLEHRCSFITRASLSWKNSNWSKITKSLTGSKIINSVGQNSDLHPCTVRVERTARCGCAMSDVAFRRATANTRWRDNASLVCYTRVL
jgi:hypothetical protein